MLDIIIPNVGHRSPPQAQVQFEARHMRQNGNKFTVQAVISYMQGLLLTVYMYNMLH